MAKIYLDYAATTPLNPNVFKAMLPYLKQDFGNTSSIHSLGQQALGAIDEARAVLADFLGCDAQEIIFTGSATEANNLVLRGALKAFRVQRLAVSEKNPSPFGYSLYERENKSLPPAMTNN